MAYASNYNSENVLKEELEKEFGQLTARQLWVLTKFAKRVRLRARNNSVYNNMCSRLFPYAKFSQVNKTKQDGTVYHGLSITVNGDAGNQTVSEDEDE